MSQKNQIVKPCVVCGASVSRSPSVWKHCPTPLCGKKCRLQHLTEVMRGSNNPDWKGGRYIEPGKGYVMIRQPDHYRARQNGYVLEHILVAEQMLGRPLNEKEVVHHLNHNPADNRPENLKIYASNVEHRLTEGHYVQRYPPCPCGERAMARGLCPTHYAQKKRTGKIWGHGLPDSLSGTQNCTSNRLN